MERNGYLFLMETRCSPFLNLTLCRLLHANHLVAVEQALRVEGLLNLFAILLVISCQDSAYKETYLAHRINCGLAQFMRQIVSLYQTNTMFTLNKYGQTMLFTAQ